VGSAGLGCSENTFVKGNKVAARLRGPRASCMQRNTCKRVQSSLSVVLLLPASGRPKKAPLDRLTIFTHTPTVLRDRPLALQGRRSAYG